MRFAFCKRVVVPRAFAILTNIPKRGAAASFYGFARKSSEVFHVDKSPPGSDEENIRPYRPDGERHGADRAGRLLVADLCGASRVRRPYGRYFHVVRYLPCPLALLRNRDFLRGTVEALPGGRVFLLFR